MNCDEVLHYGQYHVNDFKKLLNLNKGGSKPSRPNCWSPPTGELLKINIDGSFQAESRSGGWGAIVRNHLGQPLMAAAGKLNNLQDGFQAQTMA